MSVPARSRARLSVLAAGSALTLGILLPGSALATPLSLDKEQFSGNVLSSFTSLCGPQYPNTSDFDLSWSAGGLAQEPLTSQATGSYPGIFQASGQATIRNHVVTTFAATFTIWSGDTTIAGTETLRSGIGSCDGVNVGTIAVQTAYTARITTPSGTTGDAGISDLTTGSGIGTTTGPNFTEAFTPDMTPPVVTGSADRLPNGAGWYSAPVTVSWRAIDPEPASLPVTAPSPTLVTTDGTQTATSGLACDAAGNCASGSVQLSIDQANPTATAPVAVFRSNYSTSSTTTADVLVTWAASDALSGVASSHLQRSADGGKTWSDVTVPAGATSVVQTLTFGSSTYLYRVQPTDRAGNVGAWATGAAFKPTVTDDSSTLISYTGKWSHSKGISTAFGGTLSASTATGATATYAFKGASIAFVAPLNLNQGQAQVVLDGVTTNISLSPSSAQARYVWFAQPTDPTLTTHTIAVHIVGTTQLNLDGFLVWK